MPRTLVINPADPVPIWRQIEEGVRMLAVSGALAPGSPVPSVRELAAELRVNPATVAKAYQRLADAGILTVRRGEGTFVAATSARVAEQERRRVLREGAARYAALARSLGIDGAAAAAELSDAWNAPAGAAVEEGER